MLVIVTDVKIYPLETAIVFEKKIMLVSSVIVILCVFGKKMIKYLDIQ